MLKKSLTGNRACWMLVTVLLAGVAAGIVCYLQQYARGLTITGLTRDVPWGFYIAQFTFMVGVAASAVMVVLPYYLHDTEAFAKVTVLGELMAICAVCTCLLFIFVDMGQPSRVLYVVLHPQPGSLMFWDMVSLSGYLVLNVLISRAAFMAEARGVAPPRWVRPVAILSIPWAVSIHTVTAFLYAGLEARPYWLSALLAPRFLATAFSSGPAVLILICLLLRRLGLFDVGRQAIRHLGVIVAYAMVVNVFFLLLEVFTVYYSDMPEHRHHLEFLYAGLAGNRTMVPWMWASSALSVLALVLLLVPGFRRREKILAVACGAVFVGIWIEKGLGMVVAGFVPTTLGKVANYWPTMPEFVISAGIFCTGGLILVMLLKVVVTIRPNDTEEADAS